MVLTRRQFLGGLVGIPATHWVTPRSSIVGWGTVRNALGSASTPQLGSTATRQFGFFSDPDPRTVAQIAAAGLRGVSMGPYFIQDSSVDPTLGTLNLGSPQPYIAEMQHARALGLKVTLKPMVDARSYPNGGGWRGHLDPSDPAAWFGDYWQRAIEPYLEWVDTIVVYTELTTVSAKYPDAWRALVAQIRARGFRGPIVSDSDVSLTTTPWYRSLDWLGGSFYPSIDVTSDAAAGASWAAVASQMADAHRLSGMPIFMAEVDVAGLTEVEHVRWIQTMGDVLGPEPWWAGFSYWRWSQDPGNIFPASVLAAFAELARIWG